jgi:N6-L-threonylcarbamoyladenine synthase
MTEPLILGLETSCDETAAAVLRGERDLLGNVILSQDVHEVYGGVVPELAARVHVQRIDDVVDRALQQAECSLTDVDAIAVTAGPGLIGGLLVGVTWAKAVAFALGRPLVPIHHMEAHLFAPSLEDPEAGPPFVALLVSGGHTLLLHCAEWGRYRLLGATRDDAAGEAFDKVAKLLGLTYPGGPAIQTKAESGDPYAYRFPRPMLRSNHRPGHPAYYDFSFSGLKTAVSLEVARLEAAGELESRRADVAASFQEAVVDVLVQKTLRAVREVGCDRVLLGGGVSANGPLRRRMTEHLKPDGRVFFSSPRLAQDNAAMVARAAAFRLDRGEVGALDESARADLPFPGMVRSDHPTP